MRIYCYFCGKSVSTEVPDETIVRALAVCPECIETKQIIIPERPAPPTPAPSPR